MPEVLKAPFPWFGGKRTIASLVWKRLADVENYIEPFYGSGAVHLLRPQPVRGVETVNDLDCYVANFWRATQRDPEAVAAHADGPVNEADLHSRHRWLVLSDDAAAFRQKMRTDPDYFNPKIAGWWCWGLCCWIGGGWCSVPEDGPGHGPHGGSGTRDPRLVAGHGPGNGVHANVTAHENRRPVIANPGSDAGKGVHGRVKEPSQQKPYLQGGLSQGCYGVGVNKVSGENSHAKPRGDLDRSDGTRPFLAEGRSVHAGSHRPQLADAYDIGRGVNSNGDLGTCAARRAWLVDWFGRLRDRLRLVRVCCGDWKRVCDSDSVTTRLGITGVFFDPPYSTKARRDNKLYACESGTVAHDVRAYCLERGAKPEYRIALAGYEGEGHEELEAAGWEVVAWEAQGGYGNRSKKGKANAKRERLWFSPHCKREAGLFDHLAS